MGSGVENRRNGCQSIDPPLPVFRLLRQPGLQPAFDFAEDAGIGVVQVGEPADDFDLQFGRQSGQQFAGSLGRQVRGDQRDRLRMLAAEKRLERAEFCFVQETKRWRIVVGSIRRRLGNSLGGNCQNAGQFAVQFDSRRIAFRCRGPATDEFVDDFVLLGIVDGSQVENRAADLIGLLGAHLVEQEIGSSLIETGDEDCRFAN